MTLPSHAMVLPDFAVSRDVVVLRERLVTSIDVIGALTADAKALKSGPINATVDSCQYIHIRRCDARIAADPPYIMQWEAMH